jgi:KDO2-lipid IV(A) lauroyltransferase
VTTLPIPTVREGGETMPPEIPTPPAQPLAALKPRRASDRFRQERPRQLRHRLAIGLADIASRMTSLLPDRVRNALADRVGDLWIRFTPVYRANVMANLAQVLGPEITPEALEAKAHSIFRMSARNFGELLRLRHLTPDALAALVPLSREDQAVFDGARQRGQGVVLVTAHMGPFDLIGHAIAARGVPLTAISGRTTSRFLFDAVTHLRQFHNVTMVEPTPSGVRRVIRALRNGEIAGFVADYDFFQNGLPVPFFGRETTLPPGPIRIARDTGALVVPAFSRRGPEGLGISLGGPFQVPKTRDSDADVAAGMEVLKSRLEEGIRASPDQWVLFQRAWPLEPAPAMRVFPVGSPLESELLKRVDAVLPPPRDDVEERRTTTHEA